MIGPETYSVSRLCEELKELLDAAYAGVWLAGEVHAVRRHRNGHLFLEVVEKGEDDRVVAKLDAVIWKGQWKRIRSRLRDAGVELQEGVALRCRGALDLYPPFGRLQFVVHEVDPVFTLGELERRRRELLEELAEAGLLERNRGLPLAPVPLRLAVITSEASAAEHDFLTTLRESGLAFRVALIHSAVQGVAAPGELTAALRTAAGGDAECIVLVRGGGARTDLAAFDSKLVAEAVARSPLPVLTGLGHETDLSIVDRVAHRAEKTPTGVAEFLVERIERWERNLRQRAHAIGTQGRLQLRLAERRCGEIGRRLRGAGRRLVAQEARLDRISAEMVRGARRHVRHGSRRVEQRTDRLIRVSRRHLTTMRPRLHRLGVQIGRAARACLRSTNLRLDGQAALLSALDPQRTLERGFSLTRTSDGVVVRDTAGITDGDRLWTQIAEGEIQSRVEEVVDG